MKTYKYFDWILTKKGKIRRMICVETVHAESMRDADDLFRAAYGFNPHTKLFCGTIDPNFVRI